MNATVKTILAKKDITPADRAKLIVAVRKTLFDAERMLNAVAESVDDEFTELDRRLLDMDRERRHVPKGLRKRLYFLEDLMDDLTTVQSDLDQIQLPTAKEVR